MTETEKIVRRYRKMPLKVFLGKCAASFRLRSHLVYWKEFGYENPKVKTVEELLAVGSVKISRLRGIGRESMDELNYHLEWAGLLKEWYKW